MSYRGAMRFALSVLAGSIVCGCTGTTMSGPDGTTSFDGGVDAASVDAFVNDGADDAGSDAFHFVDMGTDDGGSCIASGACDPFDPSSCGAMACRPGASGTMCAAVSSTPVGVWMPCARAEDCAPGLVCLVPSPGESPVCTRMCPRGSVGRCDTGYACSGTLADPCIALCDPLPPMCDILMQDCARSTDACTLVRNPETRAPYTGCLPAGPATEGMPCGGASGACARGLICTGTTGTPDCHRVCDPRASTSMCASPMTCSGIVSAWNVHYCQ